MRSSCAYKCKRCGGGITHQLAQRKQEHGQQRTWRHSAASCPIARCSATSRSCTTGQSRKWGAGRALPPVSALWCSPPQPSRQAARWALLAAAWVACGVGCRRGLPTWPAAVHRTSSQLGSQCGIMRHKACAFYNPIGRSGPCTSLAHWPGAKLHAPTPAPPHPRTTTSQEPPCSAMCAYAMPPIGNLMDLPKLEKPGAPREQPWTGAGG